MTLEEALVSFLTADAALVALITDPNGGIKIFPEMAPQLTPYPYVTYQVVSTEENTSLASNNDFPTARLQIDVWGEATGGYAAVKALARAVKNSQGNGGSNGHRLKEFTGTMGSGPGVDVRGCRLESQSSQPEIPASGSELPVRRVTMDFLVSYVEQ